eukprot:4924574-Prymnesium_polylepis.1
MDQIGIPQKRKRVIVGSPRLTAGIRRVDKVKRNVCDVIPNPKGTHIRSRTCNAWTSKRPGRTTPTAGEPAYIPSSRGRRASTSGP